MFERSLKSIDNRVDDLTRKFLDKLSSQVSLIIEDIRLVTTSEKSQQLMRTCRNVNGQLNMLGTDSDPKKIEELFNLVISLHNNSRALLESAKQEINRDSSEKEEKMLKDPRIRMIAESFARNDGRRDSASLSAARQVGEDSNSPKNSRDSALEFTASYRKEIVIKEARSRQDDNLISLRHLWKSLEVAKSKYLTSADLIALSSASHSRLEQEAAQKIQSLLKNQLQIPAATEKQINTLEAKMTELGKKINTSSYNSIDDPAKREQARSALRLDLQMLTSHMQQMNKLQIRLLEEVMSKNYFKQLCAPKGARKSNDLIDALLKTRKSQFTQLIDLSQKAIRELEETLATPKTSPRGPSLKERITGFFSGSNKNKVAPMPLEESKQAWQSETKLKK